MKVLSFIKSDQIMNYDQTKATEAGKVYKGSLTQPLLHRGEIYFVGFSGNGIQPFIYC